MILKLNNISKDFGAVKAINNVNFEVKEEEIFGIIGPNGAGKTTLFNIITGNYAPSHGTVCLSNKSIINKKPIAIVRSGIARTFQNIRLFSSMTVLENVLIGFDNHIKYNYLSAMLRWTTFFSQEKKYKKEAMSLLRYLGIEDLCAQKATALSYGQQRKVEIARALATYPRILLLDEPAAGMNASETAKLADIIKQIKKDFGVTILLIEHDMKFVNQLCDRVLVLDYGKTIFVGHPKEAIEHEEVIRAYLGDFGVKIDD